MEEESSNLRMIQQLYIQEKKRKEGTGSCNNPKRRNQRKALDAYQAKPKPMTIIQVYAPTSSHDEETIDRFYDQLQETLDKVSKGDICIIMGDLNAKVGRMEDIKSGIGKFGLGERNERGDRLAEFCYANNLDFPRS